MRVLLVGDYSGVHSELREALRSTGVEVTLASDGDSYKGYERDVDFSFKGPSTFLGRVFSVIAEYLGVRGLMRYWRSRAKTSSLVGYDVVQIINPMAIESFGSVANLLLIKKLLKSNEKLYLCALGDDLAWVESCMGKVYEYSAMDRLNGKTLKSYLYSLRYRYGMFFGVLHRFCVKNCVAIIPGLLDYKIAYMDSNKCGEIIPLPIARTKFLPPTKTKYPVNIFHGWQIGRELKKGNDVIAMAVEKLQKEYGSDLIIYNEVKSVPYNEYIKLYADADIFIDQCYSYDRGMNAVHGMASSKVVLSGFRPESVLGEYRDIGVDTGRTVQEIYDALRFLVTDLERIDAIKSNAYQYSMRWHSSEKVAEQYVKLWSKYLV